METISLSIPCMVLSSETAISGEVEKHILTPFGYVDIILPGVPALEQENIPLEIKVVGDIDSWMIDESMPTEFKAVIRKFIVEMVQLCTQSPLPRSMKNSFHLKGENQKIKVVLSK